MNFWSEHTMSNGITIEEYLNYFEGPKSKWWGVWNVPAEIKSVTQGKLISCIESTLLENLLIALSGKTKYPEDANKILLSDIVTTFSEIKNIKNRVTKDSNRFKLVLKKEGVSICSAIVQALEPTKISIVYEARRTALINKDQKAQLLITWSEYMVKGYQDFFNEVKSLLLEGKHLNFYDKQSQESVDRPKQGRATIRRKAANSPLVHPKPATPDGTTHNTMEKAEVTSKKPKEELEPTPPKENLPEKATGDSKDTGDSKFISNDDSSGATTKTPQPKPEVITEKKTSLNSENETDIDLKPATPDGTTHNAMEKAEVSSAKPKKELKPTPPKENLLERMAREARDRELTKNKKTKESAKGKGPISYPIVFTTKSWKLFWSNSKSRTASVWSDYLWNCASIGKQYLMKDVPSGKLSRELDTNQDFVVVKKTGTKIHVLMFDGVSQSRAPRQWAEFLAEVYVEKKMNINKLKKHSKEVEVWHQTALSKWDDWVEGVYLPKRTHLPIWRLENEVKTSHTTFIAIEINKESVDIANIGDSAVFCKRNSGDIKHLPTTYDHSLGPKNISTNKLFEQKDIEYLSLKMNDLESLLACTDSIADYILDVNPEALGEKYTESLNELSSDGNKSLYMSSMIGKGPSNGGWLEDDVSFFSLVNNIVKEGEQ
jgi:serine/threonine protein phosphatase PrpC